ncbi:unnamed protein product [Rhizophagus irregularis]|nr:unnamed protein product [Rhizophagus irregularis]
MVLDIQYYLLYLYKLQGIVAVDIMEGSCTKDKFKEFVISNVVSQMNSYPAEQSVLIGNDARIHHDEDLINYIGAFGGRVEFLPPYSPILISLNLLL